MLKWWVGGFELFWRHVLLFARPPCVPLFLMVSAECGYPISSMFLPNAEFADCGYVFFFVSPTSEA